MLNRFTMLATVAMLLVPFATANAQDRGADRKGVYTGMAVGSALQDTSQGNLGVVVGYQLHPNFRVEATADQFWDTQRAGQTVMANGIAQYRVTGTSWTPYALAGAGMGFGRFGSTNNGVMSVYNVGGGLRYAVSTNFELDARYRYVGNFNSNPGLNNANVLTIGGNWRF